MKGSYRLFRLFGIPVYLHWSFGFIVFYVFYLGHQDDLTLPQTLWMLALVLLMFVCVVLHEYGHALTARRFGVDTRDIILFPIGGVARLKGMPRKPMQELLVAIAGPLVNVGIALGLSPLLFLRSLDEWLHMAGSTERFFHASNLLPALIFVNLMLAVFNMLPAFPMDGGRIFRALLSLRFRRSKATRIASYLGQALAVLLVFYGIWSGGWMLVFIAVFIFFTAGQEYRWVKEEELLDEATVGTLARRDFTLLSFSDPISKAIEPFYQRLEKGFLVADAEGTVNAVLTEKDLLRAMHLQQGEAPVITFASSLLHHLDTSHSLRHALVAFQREDKNVLPVFEQGELVGVLYRQTIRDYLRTVPSGSVKG